MADTMEQVGFQFLFSVDKPAADKLASTWSQVAKGMEKAASDDTSGKISRNTSSVAKGMEKASISTWGMTKAMVAGQAIFAMVSGFARSFLSTLTTQMPMIGQAFEAMKTVIMRNLVWPIAQALMPALLEMLKWVRENRIGFAQVGHVIVSGFRLAASIVGNFFKLVKSLLRAFGVQFGTSRKMFEDFVNYLNFLMLKVAFVFTFLSILIEPLVMAIGALGKSIYDNIIEPLTEGFLGALGDSFGLLQELVSELTAMITQITGISDSLGPVRLLFKAIGFILGTSIMIPIRLLILSIKLWRAMVEPLARAFRGFGRDVEETKDAVLGIGQAFSWIGQKIMDGLDWIDGFLTRNLIAPLEAIGGAISRFLNDPLGTAKGILDDILAGWHWLIDNASKIEMPEWLRHPSTIFGGESEAQPSIPPGAGNVSSSSTVVQDNSSHVYNVNGAQSPLVTAEAIEGRRQRQRNYREEYTNGTRGRN